VCDDTPDSIDCLAIVGIIAGVATAVILFILEYKKSAKKSKKTNIQSPKESKIN